MSRTLFAPLRNKYLIPVLVTPSDAANSFIAHKYLVISEINKELTGEYVFVLEKMKTGSGLSSMELESLILNENVHEAVIVAKRGLTSNLPNSNETAKFVKAKVKTIPTQKLHSGTTIVSNSVPIYDCTANGGTIVEIEWWYQTYINGELVYEEYLYSTYECWGADGGGGGGGGNGEESITSINKTETENETNYVSEDIGSLQPVEDQYGGRLIGSYMPIKYLHNYTLSFGHATRIIVSIIVYPVTVDQYVVFYKDSYERQVTRSLTLLNRVQNFVLTSQYSANINWFCSVNGRYTYSNGNPTFTRQWDHSKSIVASSL